MSTVQARRTLVKSAPELWAELSDAEALARRLEPLGEIRITRIEPESTVAWEGERASGTVEIEPSGFGTRVTLTAEPSEPEPELECEAVLEVEPEPEPVLEIEPVPQTDREPEPEPVPRLEPEPTTPVPPARDAELPQTMSALGQDFPIDPPPMAQAPERTRFARRVLGAFGRRSPAAPTPAPWPAAEIPPSPAIDPQPSIPTPAPAPQPAPSPHPSPAPSPHPTPAPSPHPVPDPEPTPSPAPSPQPLPDPSPAPVPDPTPVSDPSGPAQPPLDPAAAAGQPVMATLGDQDLDQLLTGVLDDLGAAHHRPFSRG